MYDNDLKKLVEYMSINFGTKVGEFVKFKINEVITLEGTDVATLQGQLNVLAGLLSTNTGNDTALAAQVLAGISGLDARVTALENDTVLTNLVATVGALVTGLQAETTARVTAIAGVSSDITNVQTSLTALTAVVAGLHNTDPVDLTGINAAIATLEARATSLIASDASQSALIVDLQSQVAALAGLSARIDGAQARADSAYSNAAAAASAAADAYALAHNAENIGNAAQAGVDYINTTLPGKLDLYVTKAEVSSISGSYMASLFDAAMRAVV